MFKILSKYGTNAKTVKSDKGGEYLTAILYMAPADLVDGINVCPMAIMAGCRHGCLNTAGRGIFDNVQNARIRKTVLYRDNRELFMEYLRQDLSKHETYCLKKGIIPVVRLNGTSDIDYRKIANEFPNIQFYDYTKVYNRVSKEIPKNYHLTISYSEANKEYTKNAVKFANKYGVNLAVVFRNKDLPETFLGRRVINGDKDDLRFLDPKNVIVGLYAKGKAKKDTSGFVINN
tara:strand:+ start:459 stop:1154 length:696 start_codon:yes stop_codon:yes gene_type:complete